MRIRALLVALSGIACFSAGPVATARDMCLEVDTVTVKKADGTYHDVTQSFAVPCKAGDDDGTTYNRSTNAAGYTTSWTSPNPVTHGEAAGGRYGSTSSGSSGGATHGTAGGAGTSTAKPTTAVVTK